MRPKRGRRAKRPPCDPWPYYLTRAGKHPDIEDAIEDVLSYPAHTKHRAAMLKVHRELKRYFRDSKAKRGVSEIFALCNDLRKSWASNVASYPVEKVEPDRLVGWAFTSKHRQFYMVPFFWENKYWPLVPGATLGMNRQLIVFGMRMGSADFPRDMERLIFEMEFGDACWAEIQKRIATKTVGGAYLSIIHGSERVQREALGELYKEVRSVGGKFCFHPDKKIDLQEKISAADWLITQDIKKLEDAKEESTYRVTAEVLGTEYEYLPHRIRNAFIDMTKKARAGKRIPEKMLEPLEDHIHLLPEMTGFTEEPEQWDKACSAVQAHAEELKDAYGPRAPELLLLLLGGEKLTNVQMGERLLISDRQVKNIKKALRDNRVVLRRVLGLE